MHSTYCNILNIIQVILSQEIKSQGVIGCIVRLQSLSALALRQAF